MLHAIHSLFYWRIFPENDTLLCFFKSRQKNLYNKKSLSPCMNSILKKGKLRVEKQTQTWAWED